MAKQTLPTNFVDDILAPSMNQKRKFTITAIGDGTYEIEDVTDYTQTGSDFGAGQINTTNQAVNESCDKADVIDSLDDIVANQASGKIAGAKAVAELNGNIGIKIVDILYADLSYPVGDTPQTIHTCSGTVTSQKDLTGCKFACSFVNGNYVSPQANPVVNLSGKSTLNISQMYRNISDGTHSFGATVLVICYK